MASTPTEPPAGALDRGLAILSYLARHREASAGEVADALGLSVSTTYRLAERLRQQQWLAQDGRPGDLRLGPAAAQLAAAAVGSSRLRDVAVPALRELLAATRETVSLAVPSKLSMVFVERERGPHSVGVSAELGASRPLHCTSVGRAYLAALPDDQMHRLLDELAMSADSPVTVDELPDLRRIITETRERGWSQDMREFDPSSCCCGAVIRDHTGAPIAAISVAGLADRMQAELDEMGPRVRATADLISSRLGYLPREPVPARGDRDG
ncbi:IclR family transcriptional regulator [Nocardioides sp. NPDC101246]|uniref:IclR family transcriptional regulator n=1 Tax=Nocardioides sp. NPDC101246 TaxID=3364336 RepID=UPI003813108C